MVRIAASYRQPRDINCSATQISVTEQSDNAISTCMQSAIYPTFRGKKAFPLTQLRQASEHNRSSDPFVRSKKYLFPPFPHMKNHESSTKGAHKRMADRMAGALQGSGTVPTTELITDQSPDRVTPGKSETDGWPAPSVRCQNCAHPQVVASKSQPPQWEMACVFNYMVTRPHS